MPTRQVFWLPGSPGNEMESEMSSPIQSNQITGRGYNPRIPSKSAYEVIKSQGGVATRVCLPGRRDTRLQGTQSPSLVTASKQLPHHRLDLDFCTRALHTISRDGALPTFRTRSSEVRRFYDSNRKPGVPIRTPTGRIVAWGPANLRKVTQNPPSIDIVPIRIARPAVEAARPTPIFSSWRQGFSRGSHAEITLSTQLGSMHAINGTKRRRPFRIRNQQKQRTLGPFQHAAEPATSGIWRVQVATPTPQRNLTVPKTETEIQQAGCDTPKRQFERG
ncbi:hypothetical protein G7Y89_g15824 [Cudoniella acicularis]|uniref:Uncharacterized protein n=1 Tax=Cudoniella acicularis TaxID=354080 RepID=A0A8H4QEU7_9HELO|nr:hypothetical protein G7Y89_g15824 [Cudoniella acicularis]